MDVNQLCTRERVAWSTWTDHLARCSRCQQTNARHGYADTGCAVGSEVYTRWRVASRKHLAALNPAYVCGGAS